MTLPFFLEDRRIAAAEDSPEGLHLRYENDWREARGAFPISLSMPLDAADHPPEVIAYWLMNLLPEGEPLRAMTRALGVAREDLLACRSNLSQSTVVPESWRSADVARVRPAV